MNGRVLIVSAEYPPMRGRVGDYTALLVDALAELGWDSRILTSASAQTDDRRVLPWVRRWNWTIVDQVRTALRETRADLVHIQYQTGAYRMHPAINLLPSRIRSRPPAAPIVTTFHDLLTPYLFPKAGPLREWVTRTLARRSDAIIVTNAQDRERLTLRYGVRRTLMIPIGSNLPDVGSIERDAVQRQIGIHPNGGIVIGFFGFLTEDKGIDVLLQALADHSLPQPATLVIIGGGLAETDVANRSYFDWLKTQFAECAIPVIETGYLAPAEAAATLRAMDLVVLPFRHGASLRRGTLIAAIRAGAVVLTTDPDFDESLAPLTGGESMWLVPPGDPDALRAAIQTLLGDRSLRARLAANAQAQGNSFDWGTIAERHVTLYAKLLKRPTHEPLFTEAGRPNEATSS